MPEQVITDRGTDAASVSCNGAGRAARFCSRPARQYGAVPSRDPMPTSPDPVASPRGVYWELYCGHRIYFAVTSGGKRLPFLGVPIGLETERDVIARLADSLDAADPVPCAPPRAALRLVRPEQSPLPHR